MQSLAHREREALNTAIGRLEALGIESDGRVYVDDENRHPSYARSYQPPCNTGHAAVDDEELDHAVAWLPSEAFQVDQSEGPYNPYITINHLRALEVLMMKTPDTGVVDGPHVTFEDMCWPDPSDPRELAYRLRYSPAGLSRRDQLVLASIVDAYNSLVCMDSRTRQRRVMQLREAAGVFGRVGARR